MKQILIVALVFIAFSATAEPHEKGICTFTYDPAATVMTWTAYKTKKKAPVNGTLKATNFTVVNKKAHHLSQYLNGATAELDGLSVDSNDSGRDEKIRKHFFALMTGGTKIKMKINKMPKGSTGKADVSLSMNGVTKKTPMVFKITGENKIEAKGSIDVLNWNMSKSLAGIAKACSFLHGKKTWSEVGLTVTSTFKKSCP